MPRNLLRAILKGVRRVIQTRLRTGRERDLLTEGPQLLRWAMTYRTPPIPLERPRKPPALDFEMPSAIRAAPRERILDAVIDLMSEKGYRSLTITDIAQRAAISLTTFYAEFDSKEEAVVAAMRRGTNRVLEVVAPVYREAADWPHAVAAGLNAFFAYLVLEQPFARFGGVGVQSGSPMIVDVRDQLVAGAHAFLAEGYRRYPGVEPIVSEAIGATIDALVFDALLSNGIRRLYELAPTATYVALAPFVGADEACTIANSSR
jgi:AcrR family transcriptional regulator